MTSRPAPIKRYRSSSPAIACRNGSGSSIRIRSASGASPDGARIAIDARGDIFVARTHKKGLIRRVSENSAARTKDPAFSPDGKWIATWSEVEGEEQLVLFSADNSGPPRQLGQVEPGWHYAPLWSPDGKHLAWADEKYQIQITDVASGKSTVIDKASYEMNDYGWSPDSHYLSYTVPLESEQQQIRIYDLTAKKIHDLTDPMWNSYSASWDPKGKTLYYLSDRFINPYRDHFGSRYILDKATLPYVVALRKDVKLPFADRSDIETPDDKKEAAKDDKDADGKQPSDEPDSDKDKGKDKDKDKKADKVKSLDIDFDGIADRIVQVPVPPDNYDGLYALDDKLHFLRGNNRGMQPSDEEREGGGFDLFTYELTKEKLHYIAGGVESYDVSMDNKVLVYRTKGGFFRVEAGATSGPRGEEGAEAHLDLSGWRVRIEPRLEWQQMLREAWRLERDFFYDPAMHGVDWKAVWVQYAQLAPRIASRDDLEDVIGEMFGELSVGHTYHYGAELRRGASVGTGMLGADLTYDPASGFWQFKKILRGSWPDPHFSSPLARPDLRVEPGMWLVAIDGKPLQKGQDYLQRLAGRAGTEVELSINTSPKLAGARRIVINALGDDTQERYATWIRENREYVEKRSNGQIGYIHLYDMGGLGLSQYAGAIIALWNKQGLIIDDRWNHGGNISAMAVADLTRPIFSLAATRHGPVGTDPGRTFHGHVDALVNRQGGSNCEALVEEFKDKKIGTVIGTRTWGGYVGIRGDKHLRDGGVVTQPEFGSYDIGAHQWIIEGHGVDPDIELDLDPDGLIGGHDVQLDFAINDLLTKIQRDPRKLPPPPPIRPRPLVPLH